MHDRNLYTIIQHAIWLLFTKKFTGAFIQKEMPQLTCTGDNP